MNKRTKNKNYSERARKREYTDVNRKMDRSHGAMDETTDSLRKYKDARLSTLPQRLPCENGKQLVEVFVEGYEDVSFWRGIFDEFESDRLTFEVNVPPREDLAKGKKVILGMLPECTPYKILCVDSDFDYLFGNITAQSKTVTSSKYLFHTYAYATENFLCYAPSLHNICVKATKNDTRIFDFEFFLAEYSRIIYPLFIWYAYSAQLEHENIFTLIEFKSSVKLNYLEVDNNGRSTLQWLERQVAKRRDILRRNRPGWEDELPAFAKRLESRGLTPECTYLFMQGHTLLDNVVMIMLNAVCEKLKMMNNARISTSTKTGVALKNELSNYNNALRNVRDVLLDNEGYKDCHLYKKLHRDIRRHLQATLQLHG